ncbi:MAG: bifunctional riboflavin kinase/FAD synthetase, partial [Bacteroidota bacterium]
MRVFHDLQDLPSFQNAILTIGSFDGVHLGHQHILEQVNQLAKQVQGESVVITFHPHPRLVVYPKDKTLRLLTTIDEKVQLFERYGIDNVVVVPFSIEFSQLSADQYIQDFLYGKFQPHTIVIGYDHRFGANRQGDINYLRWHAKNLHFRVVEIPPQEVDDIAVSSTKVRKALEEGDVEAAHKQLGHPFMLTGQVVKGEQIGTTLGFPTANVAVNSAHKLIPPDGIYAVYGWHKNQRYEGMLYIGSRPTLPELENRTIEVNLFAFDKNIYGDKIKLEFIQFLREDTQFNGLKALQEQLAQDRLDALAVFEQIKANTAEHRDPSQASSLPKVAAVILNYNTREILEAFLPSVLASTYENLEIIVADNGSQDDSLAWLQEHHPQLATVDLEKNHGFAEGYNRALAQVEADYYILLNSDVEVTPGWVDPIIEQMEKDPRIAAAQPKILAQKNKSTFEYAGAAGGWIDYLGYPFCRGRIFQTVEEDRKQYDSAQEIFWASGAAMF